MSDLLLSIDPGARGCGCAWWVRAEGSWVLLHARYAAAPEGKGETGPSEWGAAVAAVEAASLDVLGALRPDVVVVERMQVYTRSKCDPRDLLALAAIGGGLFRAFSDARPVGPLPREWKQSVPRDILGNRVEAKLRDPSRLPPGVVATWGAVRVPSRKTHLNDVLHGIGLGLWYAALARPAFSP